LQVAPPTGVFFANRRPEDVLVAERDGRLVGMAHLAPHSSMTVNSHVLHLNAIVVEPPRVRAQASGAC
jgi:N-acetylglutamate synthase-like GNAT family acetyltransferase